MYRQSNAIQSEPGERRVCPTRAADHRRSVFGLYVEPRIPACSSTSNGEDGLKRDCQFPDRSVFKDWKNHFERVLFANNDGRDYNFWIHLTNPLIMGLSMLKLSRLVFATFVLGSPLFAQTAPQRQAPVSIPVSAPVPVPGQIAQGDIEFNNKVDQNNDDMEALRRWLRDKRLVTVKEIGGDLSISRRGADRISGHERKKRWGPAKGPRKRVR